LDYFPNYAKFLTGPITARAESVFTDREPSQSVYGGDPSQSLRIDQSITLDVD